MPLASYLGNGGSIQYSFIPAEDFADGILSRSSDDRHLGLKLGSVTDGTSNTFFCGKTISYTAALNAVFVWDPAMYAGTTGNSAARTLTQVRTGHGVFSPDLATYRNNIAVLRNLYASRHTGGAVFAFVDGSTHFIAESIDHNQLTEAQWRAGMARGTYQQLFSRNDGQPLGEF